MTFRIKISGELNCEKFDHVCFIADHLSRNLPSFLYERIEKPTSEWRTWLCKTNSKYKWHHCGSPLIWKDFLTPNSKPFYIGGASEFLEYCHSYYKLDTFTNIKKIEELSDNYIQFKRNGLKYKELVEHIDKEVYSPKVKDKFVICISGANAPITTHMLEGLVNISLNETTRFDEHKKVDVKKFITKIYISNESLINSSEDARCPHVIGDHSDKVKLVPKLGIGLTKSDVFIILDHVPFNDKEPIGTWLNSNRNLMMTVAEKINASGPADLRVLLANLGPSCFNATILRNALKTIDKRNVIVTTSDLGLEIIPPLSAITGISIENIFCPPVWGFVGVNHLVDIRTAFHKYESFYPYERYKKVKNSTLKIGFKTPELRTFEYLMYNNESLWIKVAERKTKEEEIANKSTAVINVIKIWLSGPGPDDVVNLGIACDGSFGLKFKGVFSQPSRFKSGFWKPANNFMLPKDPQVKIHYLEYIAEIVMCMEKTALPRVWPQCPPYIKRKIKPINQKKQDLRFAES